MSESSFTRLSSEVWKAERGGYVVTVQGSGDGGFRATVTNPSGAQVDESTFFGLTVLREARWMLDSAVAAGE